MRKRLAFVASLIAQTLFWSLNQPSPAQQTSVSDGWIDKRYDWVMYIDVRKLDKYLTYNKSTVGPVSKVEISCRYTNRGHNKSVSTDTYPYEDLYFHDGKILGAHRYTNLPMTINQQGIVWVKPIADTSHETVALSGSIVRIILDLYATQTIVSTISVPLGQYDAIASALGTYNFFPFQSTYPGGPGQNMSLHLTSDPLKIDKYYYYDDMHR